MLKYCYKGQHLAEFAIIGSVILGICLISVIFFGDNIAAVFKDNKGASLFNKERSTKQVDTKSLISNVKISADNISVSSPIEARIRSELLNNSYTQTSGSAGNVRETLEILQEYINQLESIMQQANIDISESSPIGKAIKAYKDTIKKYVDKDNAACQGQTDCSTLQKVVNDLDISVDLKENGEIATNLNNAILDVLNKNTLSPEIEKLLTTYNKDILSLGNSIDYTMDSRISEEFNLVNTLSNIDNTKASIEQQLQTILDSALQKKKNSVQKDIDKLNSDKNSIQSQVNSLTTEKNNIQNNINNVNNTLANLRAEIQELQADFASADFLEKIGIGVKIGVKAAAILFNEGLKIVYNAQLNNKANELNNKQTEFSNKQTEIDNKTKEKDNISTDTQTSEIITEIQTLINSVSLSENIDYTAVTEKIEELSSSISDENQLNQLKSSIYNLNNQKTKYNLGLNEYYKMVDVYRNGNYNEIVPGSYNNLALCTAIGGKVTDGNCTFN